MHTISGHSDIIFILFFWQMHCSGYLCSYQTTNHPVLRSVQFCQIRQLRILKIQSIWILMAGFMCSEGFFSLYYIIVNIRYLKRGYTNVPATPYVNFVCVALSLALQQHSMEQYAECVLSTSTAVFEQDLLLHCTSFQGH